MKKNQIIAYVGFMLIMMALGASDSMRGIFSGIFESHFALSKTQVSMIVTISYVGNLVFILFGSRLADRYDKKKVCLGILLLWAGSLLLYILSDSYSCLLLGMFISMGTSTLMNTMINILSPAFFGASAGMLVNTLFFTQGIGTSANQSITGRYAEGYASFQLVNGILLLLGIAGGLILLFLHFPEDARAKGKRKGTAESLQVKTASSVTGEILKNKAFYVFVLSFGFYFIAEHGIMNWWLSYCTESLRVTRGEAASYLSLFWGGMTLGRLLLSPFVTRLGIGKSILTFGGIGTLLYAAGVLFREPTLLVVSLSGFFLSIVYPTLVIMINQFFAYEMIASATGYIISAATIFDILFNACFGSVLETVGFSMGILIFPVCMLMFYMLFLVLRRMEQRQQG